ncbi:polygalacturonase QRT3-like isoform X1 [Primulina eburnea]|uniref:polygalacturonase QRT3-like isoform X1 n=2 Tax=Primulina eburnea TaxID=1245227 RepID=UPI003C6C965D
MQGREMIGRMENSIFLQLMIVIGFVSFITTQVYAHPKVDVNIISSGHVPNRRHHVPKHKASPPLATANASTTHVYHVTSYGADPTGKTDSTNAIIAAVSDALNGPGSGFLINGIVNLGGARIDLDGGNYLISRPIQFPVPGRGNLFIQGGSLMASNEFPNDSYLIDLSLAASTNGSDSEYYFEFVTLRDLFLNCNYRGGGIQVVKSLRINIDNCYITHFSTVGVSVKGGHETSIRHSTVGQHITAGGDPAERNVTGIGIELAGNDNSITDVVVFSAAIGIMLSGQANTITAVHCYNKATGFGGTGIYIKLPGLAQTRIVNSYLDYTGIVAEDPVQLTISNSFFLGDAYVVFKSMKGVVSGVNIVDNMFTGSNKGIDTVQLDQTNGAFKQIDQVVIDGNNVNGMNLRSTIARRILQGNNSLWEADFNSALVFPDLIKRAYYTFIADDATSFPVHALRNISSNKVVIQSQTTVSASVHITADQGGP